MQANDLWRLPPKQFNDWRRKNDYPIIFAAFEAKLPHFSEWMEETRISKELMFEHGLGIFVGSEELWSVFHYKHNNETRVFRTHDIKISHLRRPDITTKEVTFEPYLYWLSKNKKKALYKDVKRDFRISSWIGGKPQFMESFFLLNLGKTAVKAPILSDRLLDFVCLDDLKMIGAINNTHLHIWFSSAKGLEIKGGVAFLDFFKTPLWDSGYGDIKKELVLSDGLFQGFNFKNCELRLHAIRSKLTSCNFEGINFEATMEYSEILDSQFSLGENEFCNKTREMEYYKKIKSLYSSIGNHYEAGKFFYKEKVSEMLSFLRPQHNFKDKWRYKGNLGKSLFTISCVFKFLFSFFSFLVWGYGERPIRSLFCSLAIVAGSAAVYFINPASVTSQNISDSVYFSMVTFVTLGYGDISQSNTVLKLYAACQAFTGMVVMGLFLAGFASKSKQY